MLEMYIMKCYYSLEMVRTLHSNFLRLRMGRQMRKEVFCNNRTHRLHINGYRRESKRLPYDTIFLNTYDGALAYDARVVGLWKMCQKKNLTDNNARR